MNNFVGTGKLGLTRSWKLARYREGVPRASLYIRFDNLQCTPFGGVDLRVHRRSHRVVGEACDGQVCVVECRRRETSQNTKPLLSRPEFWINKKSKFKA